MVRSRRPRVVGSLQATLQGARPLPRPRLGHARAPTVTLPVRGSPGQSGQQAALGHTACAETRAAEGWGRNGRRAGPWELSPTGRRAGSVGRAGQGRLGELMRGTPLPLDAAGAQTGRSQLVLGGQQHAAALDREASTARTWRRPRGTHLGARGGTGDAKVSDTPGVGAAGEAQALAEIFPSPPRTPPAGS